MAIYQFSVSVISRSKGLSLVSIAGQYACEELHDARLGRTVDFVGNYNIVFKKIFLPQNALVWMSDRGKLWNAVDGLEPRENSHLAREINVSLPRELAKDQNIKLAIDFVHSEFVAHGMVADLCIYKDKYRDGEEQLHAHVMLTMRAIIEGGFGFKKRSWDAKRNITLWRESWVKHVNRYLALNGIVLGGANQWIDH